MNAVIIQTLSDGHVMRMCTRCTLKMLEDGSPDPYFYNQAQIEHILSLKNPCTHTKTGMIPTIDDEVAMTSNLALLRRTLASINVHEQEIAAMLNAYVDSIKNRFSVEYHVTSVPATLPEHCGSVLRVVPKPENQQ